MTVILGKDQSTLIFSNEKTFSDYNVLIVYYHTKCDRHTQTLKFEVPFVRKFLPSVDFLYVTTILTMQDGTSNYLKGLMLVLCYLIVAASFFVHIDPSSIG